MQGPSRYICSGVVYFDTVWHHLRVCLNHKATKPCTRRGVLLNPAAGQNTPQPNIHDTHIWHTMYNTTVNTTQCPPSCCCCCFAVRCAARLAGLMLHPPSTA